MNLRTSVIFLLFFSFPAFPDYDCKISCFDNRYYVFRQIPDAEITEFIKIMLSSICEEYQGSRSPSSFNCTHDPLTPRSIED